MTKEPELLPCPMCGGDETSHGYVAAGGIEWGTAGCEACDLQVMKGTEAEAIAAWNQRIPDPKLLARIEALEGALEHWADQPTTDEAMHKPDLKWAKAEPMERVRMLGERKEARDAAILNARALINRPSH